MFMGEHFRIFWGHGPDPAARARDNRQQDQQCWLMLVLVGSLELFIFVVPGTTRKMTARRPANQPATEHLASNDQQCWLVLVLVGILELFIIVLMHLFLEINAHV